MKSNQFELQVLVKNRAITEYSHFTSEPGDTSVRNYVEGRENSEFELKLYNRSSKKVLMIPSVDGLSVLDGKPASENSSGYIVDAYGSLTIPGWTLDNNSVAKFIFAGKAKSYAALNSDNPSTENVGVIGVLVWSAKEQPKPTTIKEYVPYPVPYYPQPWNSPWSLPHNGHPWYSPYSISYTCSNSPLGMNNSSDSMLGSTKSISDSINCMAMHAPACADANDYAERRISVNTLEPQEFSLGTGFGESTSFNTVQATFEKDTIVATLVIYYDSKKNLEKLGIVFHTKEQPKKIPQAFPGTGCKPPIGWQN